MCGIAGLFDTKERRPIDRVLLERMTSALVHRGPDGAGYHVAPGVGLGHRRLAIIDLAGGDQPMFNEDGTVAIVFNGEIYNFQALCRELTDLGHRFRSHCDTEVIVHAWEEWGEGCLARLRGMFAFAIYDDRQQALFLARDRLGEKPLYYTLRSDGVLLFASELKGLLTDPTVPRTLDPQAVEDYFAFGYVPEPGSIYSDIRKLPAAHCLRLKRGGGVPAAPQPYWDVRFEPRIGITEEAACEELIALLRDSVKGQTIADVPLGAFLSGGVDSSGVVAMMAGVAPERVNTFSISFGERDHDESPYATAMAARYDTRHRSREVNPESFDLVDRLGAIYDEPFGDSSALPTLQLCAMTREHVTVALSGDAGDELFAGYRRYLWHAREERIRSLVPAALRAPLFGGLAHLYPKADWAPRVLRAKTTFQELALDPVAGFFSSVSVIGDDIRHRLLSAATRRDLQGYHPSHHLAEQFARAGTADPLSQAQYADLKTYLPGDILTKVDRASMACSLEVRVPLLDHRIVEWAAALPPEFRLKGAEGKQILKRALRPHVADDILYRPKRGFSMPLTRWFRGPLYPRIENALNDPMLADTGLFDMATVRGLLAQHRSGLRDHAEVLWSLLCFSGFLRATHNGQGAAPSAEERAALAGLPTG
jgi:asparagine synthase (glutamine-hydrolysing)